MKLTREEKNAELQKQLTLVHATFDYLTIHFGRLSVCDDVASNEVMYNQQKLNAETLFKEQNLSKLKKMLKDETHWLAINFDLEFGNYIKKNTEYEIDIFAEIKSGAEEVLKKGKIENKKEQHNVVMMISLYEKTIGDLLKIESLQLLLENFYQGEGKTHYASSKYTEEHTELVETIEKDDGTIEQTFTSTVTYWDGPKPSHYNTREETAPDGKHKLTLTECTQGKYSSTSVSIDFSEIRIEFYHAVGIHPNIHAFWKDNTTIIIETNKSYTTHAKYRKVESYGDVIDIEYVEN